MEVRVLSWAPSLTRTSDGFQNIEAAVATAAFLFSDPAAADRIHSGHQRRLGRHSRTVQLPRAAHCGPTPEAVIRPTLRCRATPRGAARADCTQRIAPPERIPCSLPKTFFKNLQHLIRHPNLLSYNSRLI